MTKKPQSVRIATPADEAGVFILASMAHRENAVAPMDEGKVIDKIRIGTHGRGGIIGVIPGPCELEAIVMMELSQQWYSNDYFLAELFAFVHPGYRKSEHAKDLLGFSKWAAEQMKMPLIMGVLSNQRTKAKVRLYRRQITLGGALFIHNHEGFKELKNDAV